MREKKQILENWKFVKTAENAETAIKNAGEAISLPHTWNAVDGQDGGNDYYRGTCWYVKELGEISLPEDQELWLELEGAAMTAEVFFNGKLLTHHEGGYSTFRVNLTDHLAGENILAISVDNSSNDRVYPQKADFTFYGGIYRPVSLIAVPKAHFALGHMGGTGIKVTPELNDTTAKVTLEAWVEGDGKVVTFKIDDLEQYAQVVDGYAHTEILLENVHRWNGLKDPYLYTVTATLDSGDVVETRFGCRTMDFDPENGFILNGEIYPLHGVSRHQDRAGVGNALTPEMHREDLDMILDIGANTVRLAHYQHSQYFYDLCDEKGLVLWAEIPYITMHMPNGRANTLSQMEELVVQNYNHPSIVCWGLSNEITAAGGVTEDLMENHHLLNDLCHNLDSTRPTTMAHVFMLETDSPLIDIPDIGSYNLYFGWYLGDLEQNDEFFDEYHEKFPSRVIGLSEYGADANPAFQSPSPEKGDYTETYQALYHEHMLQMFEQRPYLWATHVWNMFDFAADGRDEGGKHGVNQKGLVTMDRKLKKDAFFAYKAYWSADPFVHICGSRYVDRVEDVTDVKVYSNQPNVALYVDGKLFEEVEGNKVFLFHVPMQGEHVISAKAGDCSDEIRVRKVAEPNMEYRFQKDKELTNWFDDIGLDPTCFSIKDTLGDLRSHPASAAIVNRMMEQASASRGEVAESVKDNPALQRMMGRMTLESLLKQAGDAVPPAQIEALNSALQQIKKN